MDVDVSVSNALDELSNVLSAIAESPYSLGLHAKHISLATSPDLSDQLESATELLTSFFAAPSHVWLAYLQSKMSKLGIPDDLNYEEPVALDLKNVDPSSLDDLFECFRKATSDYLSQFDSAIPVLQKQIQLLISLHAFARSNPQLEPLLSEENTRSAIDAAVSQGLGHLTQGLNPSREQWETYITTEQRAKSSNDLLLNSLYERAISDFANRRWEALLDSTDSSKRRQDNPENEYWIVQRAARNVPTSGYVWAKYFRILERLQEMLPGSSSKIESVADVYEKVLSISELKNEVREVIQVVLAKCSFDKRHMEGIVVRFVNVCINRADLLHLDENDLALLVVTLEEGIKLVRNGDCQSYMPMFTRPYGRPSQQPKKETLDSRWRCFCPTSMENEYLKARNVFKNLPYKIIDWPERLWQQWSNFEYLYGSIEDIDECLEKIDMFSSKLRKKREEEALQLQQAWFSATQDNEVNQPRENTASASETVGGNNLKRRAESPPSQDVHLKRIKQEEPPKRDRENATIFVNYLPLTANENDLDIATVEFMDKDSIPAALTKDKKRIHDQEIAVHLAWKSTLYVTNFPENMDDSSIRELFRQDAAISALVLNARELEPNRALTVYISDPARKQTRTDASANVREIHVAGLAKSVKEEDLRKFFSAFGTIREVRMPTDGSGNFRGFGFIEFEDEASASSALKANNEEFKKRRLAVTLADMRPPKHDQPGSLRKARIIKVRNLPPNAQEGLLQQTMENFGKINKVEIFRKANEALVEFENSQDVGRLLLEGTAVRFGDQQLELMEYDLPATSRGSTSSVSMFLPRGGARPRAGLGSKKMDNRIKTQDIGLPPPSDGNNNKNQDDFRRMLNPNI
ncbi:hypothetical protein Clacol_003753 [Clathrus columnatus]|uniref:RRM domain-containing protein n=1 Tax=Clathrus columnatus TaxID=1419009 RepID=A0AAV5A9A8_9AGAM|nr:hypothetical protein Clacol_003753 [Clathrus columnatus]